jgi:hypothetical protein
MSKPTETLVCLGKHTVSVGKRRGGDLGVWGSVGKRGGRSERGDAGAHHVTVNLLKILAAPAYIYGPLLWV